MSVIGRLYSSSNLTRRVSAAFSSKLKYCTNQGPNEKTTHYGFQTVTESEKAKKVHGVFESVASSYDLMNDLMSAGIHRAWKDYFVGKLSPIRTGTRILDVAGGTGDIAFRIARQLKDDSPRRTQPAISDDSHNDSSEISNKSSHIVVCDLTQAMLDVGKQRAFNMGLVNSDKLSWLCADAQDLPLENDTFDAYTIAFGIRNVVNIPKALDEAYRVLKPGGRFLCLEFSHVTNPLLRKLYDAYSFQVIPPMGQVVAGDWDSYQYLVESIRKFPQQEEFKVMIENAGFRSVTYENLTFGVVAIHSGYKL